MGGALPPAFLGVLVQDLEIKPSLRTMCPGFELKKWRAKRLARHLVDWLPDFALRIDEFSAELSISQVNQMMEDAAKRMYSNTDPSNRGEVGELLLHVCCRQVENTFPAVSKLFYKTATNDVVKGFDLVHTKLSSDEKLEIWLGEAKIWQNGPAAVKDAIASIKKHLDAGFLTSEKTLVGPKISQQTPGYDKLQWIFNANTSLDEIFDRLVVPVMIAYDSDSTANWKNKDDYKMEIASEVAGLHAAFMATNLEVKLVCFYVPMDNKNLLVTYFETLMQRYAA